MKNKKKVAVIGTIYGLLIYLLHASDEDFTNTCFFLNEKYSWCGKALPKCILLEDKRQRNDSLWWNLKSLLWGLGLRIKRMTIWRKYFKNAEIYAQDQFSFAAALIGSSEYVLISDGFNDFSCHISSELYEISSEWCREMTLKKRIIRFFFGPTWMGWFGLTEQCRGLLHENPVQISYCPRKNELLKVDFQAEWESASERKKERICKVFDVQAEEIRRLSSCKVMLFAQPFELVDLSEEELAEIYRKTLQPYDPADVVIKTHPIGVMDYRRHFPGYFVFDKCTPMQLLLLCGVKEVRHVITINSTAVALFPPETEIIWLGTECHPVLFQHYGRSIMEEILFLPGREVQKNSCSTGTESQAKKSSLPQPAAETE